MQRLLPPTILVVMLVAACGTAQPSARPVPVTAAPTIGPVLTPAPAPTQGAASIPAPTSPFAGQPYLLDLPAGWQTFDLTDPSGSAALDVLVAANPEMGPAIAAFKALPNVTVAVNVLLGNGVVALSLPTGGLSVNVLSTTFTAQFAAVPGVVLAPQPEPVTLAAGSAVHWDIQIKANAPSGGTYEVGESVYLIANDATAVLVEFVEVGGAGIPQEQQIINSLQFTP